VRRQYNNWGPHDYELGAVDPETGIEIAKILIEDQHPVWGWRYSLYLARQRCGFWVYFLRSQYLLADVASAEARALAALESVSAEEVEDILLSRHGARPSVTAGL